MGHDHSHHNHAHGADLDSFDRAFAIGVALNLIFVCVEAGYGLVAGSIALVADAGHNLSDLLGLLLAWGASVLARRRPTGRRTYGFRRSSILAALFNAVLLLVAVGGIAWEAIRRFSNPAPVDGGVVIWVAAAGILVNGVTALLFMRGRKSDLNIKGAYLHMAADAGVSAGVVVAGIAIAATGWFWLDPAVSLAIVVVITAGTWGLLRESFDLAMDVVPRGIDRDAVESYLLEIEGVTEVHDLHIWGMSTTETALTAHIIVPEGADPDAILSRLTHDLAHEFHICHTTIQIERGSYPCSQAPETVL
jgi:cobalt-zinc-cadmium efflux system protein